MSSPELLDYCAEDVEEVLIGWLTPLNRCAATREVGDPLPFILVTHITGTENVALGVAEPIVSVHTLCDKSVGFQAAKIQANNTHRRMLRLARYIEPIRMNNGSWTGVDYVTVFQAPIWVAFQNTQILRKVARYRVGLSYVPAETT
jgi:hypothetical protein